MPNENLPKLITAGVIASAVSAPIQRVTHILNSRPHIKPVARAGHTRLYTSDAIAQVRHELNVIDARRAAREVAHA